MGEHPSGSTVPDFSDFQKEIKTTTLPDQVRDLVEGYAQQIGYRNEFVWRWIYSLLPAFRLSCVADTATNITREQKTILTIFITTLDDIAEHKQDTATFSQARNIPFPEQIVASDRADVDQEMLAFATRVWETFEESLRDAPRYDEFIDVFRYDIRQTINAMDYSRLVSAQPAAATLTGAKRYDAHNMVMFPYADVDLMYSPSFDRADFTSLREVLWTLQYLARIGNWLTTWERELAEGDYSSGILVTALQSGVITPAELTGENTEADIERYIARIKNSDIEEDFITEWEETFAAIRDEVPAADSIDLNALIDGMQTVFEYHRKSRGLK